MAKKDRKYDDCKGPLKHRWFLTDVERASEFGIPTWHMCERCTTVRITIIDRRGDLMSRRYKYPEGYKEEGRIPASIYRLQEVQAFRRAKRHMKESQNT